MRALLFITILFPLFIFSQDKNKKKSKMFKWELGINGGVNITNVSGLEDAIIDNRIGRLYGVTVIYHWNRFVAFKTDIDFENKGWTLNNYEISTMTSQGLVEGIKNINQNLDYFDIPAFFHVGFGKKIKFDLNFGPYFAFLLESSAYYIGDDGVQVNINDPAFTDFSKIDFGLTYGGGIDYALNNRLSLGFDLLYERGIKAIQEGGIKNRSLDFDFGINILLGKK